jgi:HlyD family secretion protein
MRYVILLLVSIGLLTGAWWLTRPKPITVTLHTVTRGAVRATVSNTRVGTVEACHRARMSPSVPGQVALLPVREGQQVEAGTVLMEIWNEDFKAQLRHAEAEIGTAARRVEEMCTQSAGAQREAQRLQRMGKQRLISEDALDVANTRAAAAQSACGVARANVEVAREARGVVAAQIDKTRLRAPFAGIVAKLNAKLGEFITPSPTGILTLPAVDLIDMHCLYVSAPIDEVDAPRIKPGLPACVSLDAFADKRCEAVVRRVAPYVLDREKQARTVEVEVVFTDEKNLAGLLPGYSADIEVLLETQTDVLRVPTEAVLKGNRVLVYLPASGRLEERQFKPGLANWEYTQARDGLAEGTQIVLSVGRDGVQAGAVVQPDTAPTTP